jgi:hypothetical protein
MKLVFSLLIAALQAKLLELSQVQEVDFDPAVDDTNMTSTGEFVQSSVSLSDQKSDHDLQGCLIELGHNIFNLQQLSLKNQDYQIKSTTKNISINFNICSFTTNRCPDKDRLSFANLVNENNTCSHLSGDKITN